MTPAAHGWLHNWRLKVSALGLSVFLWALVQTEPRNSETFSAIPVQVHMLDTAWMPSGPPVPSTVELRLGGPAREIIRLARQGTSLSVPVSAVGSGDTLITLQRDWVEIGAGSGVTVESVSPPNIRVSFEPALSRVVPVATRVRGELPADLALAGPLDVNPRSVRVRGAASRVRDLDSLLLEPLDLARIDRSGAFPLALDTSGLGGAVVVPATATLGIQVEENVTRTLAALPIMVDGEGSDGDIVADPAAVEVRLTGARTLVGAVDPTFLRVWVPPELLRGMAPGESRRVPLRVGGVPSLVAAEPAVEAVTIRRSTERPSGPGAS